MKTTKAMKAAMTLFTATVMTAGAIMLMSYPARAEEAGKPPLLAVDALASKAKDYSGKTIVLHGVVDRVSKRQGRITLIDPSEANCKDACQKNIVIATIDSKAKEPLPEARKEVLIYGSIRATNAPLQFAVTRIIADPDQIKELIAANKEAMAR